MGANNMPPSSRCPSKRRTGDHGVIDRRPPSPRPAGPPRVVVLPVATRAARRRRPALPASAASGGPRRAGGIPGGLLPGAPHTDADRRPGVVGWSDLDPVGHVNTAVSWEPVQEELARRGRSLIGHTAELEFRRPISHTSPVTLLTAADLDAWIIGPQERVFASARVRRRQPARPIGGSPGER